MFRQEVVDFYRKEQVATHLEVLQGAVSLLEQGGIGRGSFAVDDRGLTVGTFHKNATRFCTVGAIARSYYTLHGEPAYDLKDIFQLLNPYMDEGRVTQWNDAATDEEILGVLKASINAERSRLGDVLASAVTREARTGVLATL